MRTLRRFGRWVARLVPFGILVHGKPRHFREMLAVLWDNRGRWGYAWRILRHGVCDGCSLGPRGLRDDVIPGVHLCLTRLKLLRLNTMGPIADDALGDIEHLRTLSNEALHRLGRVPYPLIRRAGEPGFTGASWDDALALVGDALRAAKPDAKGFYLTSRGLTNETYYLAQKVARLTGTPHVDTCARLCHAASTVGLKATVGWAAPTMSLSDWIGTDLILIIGSNLPNNQPVSTKYLRAARKAGARVVVVNPFREPALERYWIPSIASSAVFGTKLMDDYFAVRPGGDIAFLSGVLKALDEAGGWDEAFVAEHTIGADVLRARLASTSWDEITREAGVSEQEMRGLATLYGRAKTCCVIYSMGLTQYEFGVENVKMVVNFALARGMFGRPNCGVMPIRGHSGVQGSAECGADPGKLPGGIDLNDANCAHFEQAWGHPIPRRVGLRAAQLLDAAGERGLDVLYLVGGNHLETMPDRQAARRALERVRVRVHQDIVLNSSTLLDATETVVVLPAATRYEQKGGGTSTSTERRIRYSPEIAGPRIAEARAEWEVLAAVGQRAVPEAVETLTYHDAGDVRREMGELMPLYEGIEGLSQEGDWVQWGGPQLGRDGFGHMPGGRARFADVVIPRIDVPEGRLLLALRRGKQFNSITYGDHDPLLNASRSDLVLDPRDLEALGLDEGDAVVVRSDLAEVRANVRAGPCRRGHVQGYWPELNALVQRHYDQASGEPDYTTTVSIERA